MHGHFYRVEVDEHVGIVGGNGYKYTKGGFMKKTLLAAGYLTMVAFTVVAMPVVGVAVYCWDKAKNKECC